MHMIRSHHITAQLAREHQNDLLLAARGVRGDVGIDGPVESAGAALPVREGRTILRHWRPRFGRPRASAGAGECREPAVPAGPYS